MQRHRATLHYRKESSLLHSNDSSKTVISRHGGGGWGGRALRASSCHLLRANTDSSWLWFLCSRLCQQHPPASKTYYRASPKDINLLWNSNNRGKYRTEMGWNCNNYRQNIFLSLIVNVCWKPPVRHWSPTVKWVSRTWLFKAGIIQFSSN